MATRTRFLITTAVLCHLILTTRLVTSQLLAVASPQKTGISSSNRGPGPAIISALHQEKDGAVYKLRGNVRIEYASYIFSGDNVIYDSDSGDVTADGNLVLEGGPNSEHIEAARGTYNLQNETGRFEHVRGSIGLPTRGRHILPST